MSKPSIKHWQGVKRIFRYFKGTCDYYLMIKPSKELTAYVDSDWANDEVDRKSMSDFVIMFGNALVGWKSRK